MFHSSSALIISKGLKLTLSRWVKIFENNLSYANKINLKATIKAFVNGICQILKFTFLLKSTKITRHEVINFNADLIILIKSFALLCE